MPADFLSSAIDLIGKTAARCSDEEFASALDGLEALSRAEDRQQEFSQVRLHLKSIRQALHGSALAERGLNLLIDTTQDLAKTLMLEDLMGTVVARARSLIGANIAWVTLLDEKSGVFRTVAAEGNISPNVNNMTSRLEYGAVSLIMKSKGFFDTQDYLNDQRFQHLPELDQAFEVESIMSLAGFPILSDADVFGFLFIADRHSRKLSGREISVLGSFALHAGVAMRNANTFKLLSEALEEAQRNRQALLEHIQRVEASATAHDEMTSLLASGAEIQHFLQRMACQIGGAVLLIDKEFHVRDEFVANAYSGELAAEFKADRIEHALFISASTKSRHSGRSEIVLKSGNELCRTIALHGGAGRGESLVICHLGDLDAIEIRNLERSAVALSIAKLWNEKRETEKQIASSTLLRHLALVVPADPPTVSAVRDRLGLKADQPVMLSLIAIADLDRADQTTIVRDCAAKANLMVDLFDDTYLAMGPEPALRAFLKSLVKRCGEGRAGGIISEAFTNLTETADIYSRMDKALQVLRKMSQLERFIEQQEVSLFAKIFEVGNASRLARYMEELLKPIATKAPRQQQQLKQTLLCYFDGQHNIKQAARVLGVHVNTIRQRLDTLKELTGGWDDPVKALELHVALRLDAIIGPDPGHEGESPVERQTVP